MKKWYLIRTKPRQEQIAIDNLCNQNYHTYCPKGLVNKKNVVLFPGYLFIQLDINLQNWSPIKSTKGVSNFVRFGMTYAQIPERIIEFIKASEKSTSEKINNFSKLTPGDNVLITEGVFKNYNAIFESLKSDERVILLMNILGQQQTINIERKSLFGL